MMFISGIAVTRLTPPGAGNQVAAVTLADGELTANLAYRNPDETRLRKDVTSAGGMWKDPAPNIR
jgi:hypothetical protein